MELTAAKSQGFGRNFNGSTTGGGGRLHAVVGVMTSFGTKNRRDAIRNSWMPKGTRPPNLLNRPFLNSRVFIGFFIHSIVLFVFLTVDIKVILDARNSNYFKNRLKIAVEIRGKSSKTLKTY